MTADKQGQTFYRYFPVAKRDQDWGLYITTVGTSQFGPGTSYPPSGHPRQYSPVSVGRLLSEYQIVYISAGGGWFKAEGLAKQKIEAGRVLFIFPGVRHSYAPSTSTGWNEHWVGFEGNFIRGLMRHDFFDPRQPILKVGNEEKLLALFNEMIEITHNNSPASQQILSAMTINILALLYSGLQSNGATDEPGMKVIQEAIVRMRESAETPLDIEELAHKFHVSYRSFRRAFARHTGLSPHRYLQEIRLARARTLLSQSTLSIKEIALRTGFEDTQYFCRMFHKKVGMAPTAFRNAHKKS
ncbi:MAG TPA: AraC family transcriptional regulator [Candidatus Sulfotelmatobacter sp.]|nr:AraC family transcriptional regulator [Candidatus Sulfotelmatobacter sp.]